MDTERNARLCIYACVLTIVHRVLKHILYWELILNSGYIYTNNDQDKDQEKFHLTILIFLS